MEGIKTWWSHMSKWKDQKMMLKQKKCSYSEDEAKDIDEKSTKLKKKN